MEIPCVDMETLSDIVSGTISADERQRIVAHIKTCPECFLRVNSALLVCCDENTGASQPLPDKEVRSFVKRLEKKIKKPLWDIRKRLQPFISWRDDLAPDLPSVYGYARNQADSLNQIKIAYIQIEKRFGDIKTLLLFEKYLDRFNIHIRVSHPHTGVCNIRFNLLGEEGPVSRLLKEGHASFEDFPFGAYELVMIHQQKEKGSYHFQMDNRGLLNGENTLS